MTAKLTLIGFSLVVIFCVNLLVTFFHQLILHDGVMRTIHNDGIIPKYMEHMSKFDIWLEIVVLAPLLEELGFRGIFEKNIKIFKVSICVFAYLLCSKILGINFYQISWHSVIILLIASSLYFIRFTLPNRKNLRQPLIFISAIGFAFWHYYNFDFSESGMLTVLLILLPFFINGLIFTYVTLKAGVQWSILLHMINNAWPLLLFSNYCHILWNGLA